VLVCGAASDREPCAEVAARAAEGVVSLAGETGITLQAGLCATASLAVCNDSGLAHLAAAVGAPTVVIFGSTSSAWTAPLGERVRVVQRAPVCSPCFQRTCAIGYGCLTSITVADVERACREVAA
jgi:heptosyltransferase-2